MASIGEANLLRLSRGLIPVLPGMNGPVNQRRMDDISLMLTTMREALIVDNGPSDGGQPGNDHKNLARRETLVGLVRAVSGFLGDARFRNDAEPLLEELQSVIQMVAVEVLEIRGSRAMRSILRL
jgi:hypothetical protein